MSKKKISQPYNRREILEFLRNHLFGPWKRYQGLTNFIPKNYSANKINQQITLGFIGDIMSLYGKKLYFSSLLKDFFSNCDYLIGNFEGVLTEKRGKALFPQIHTKESIEILAELLPPEKIILCCANNHSADFGQKIFDESYQKLKDYGFKVIGKKDEPSIILRNKINLVNVTFLSNKPTNFLSEKEEISTSFLEEANMNILLPHWGYELQLYPHPSQVKFAQKMLEKWDIIVGHHSHNPQPISSFVINEITKITAFSLGNFCFGLKNRPYHQNGIILKIGLGSDKQNNWQISNVKWSFIEQKHLQKDKTIVDLVNQYKFFKKDEM